MRIGVDMSCWANPRGYGRFTRELVTELIPLAAPDSLILFADESTAPSLPGDAPHVEVRAVPQSTPPTEAASSDGNRSPMDMLRFSMSVHAADLDVFFFPSVYTFFPLPPGLRSVVTIHDAIAERFPELTLPSPRARMFWNAKVRLAIYQADIVMTVSDYAARDLENVLGVSPGRIRVSGEAPSPAYRPVTSKPDIASVAKRIGLPDGARWYTYVGGFNPHKHLDVLVRAHARLEGDTHLVLVGPSDRDVFHGNAGTLDDVIQQAGAADRVHSPGFLSDDDLAHLHSGAIALVLPSACEGYGLPAVEAAACGCAVIATMESPLPEILEGGGLWITPGDENDLFGAMDRMRSDVSARTRMAAEALQRANLLSWPRAAQLALDAIHEAAA